MQGSGRSAGQKGANPVRQPVKIGVGKAKLGKAKFKLEPGARKKVKVKLTRTGKKAARGKGSLTAKAKAKVKGGPAETSKIKLKR